MISSIVLPYNVNYNILVITTYKNYKQEDQK